MKKFLVALLPIALSAAAAFGLENEDSTVSWRNIVGVITAPGVDNPVGTIMAEQVHGRHTAVTPA